MIPAPSSRVLAFPRPPSSIGYCVDCVESPVLPPNNEPKDVNAGPQTAPPVPDPELGPKEAVDAPPVVFPVVVPLLVAAAPGGIVDGATPGCCVTVVSDDDLQKPRLLRDDVGSIRVANEYPDEHVGGSVFEHLPLYV